MRKKKVIKVKPKQTPVDLVQLGEPPNEREESMKDKPQDKETTKKKNQEMIDILKTITPDKQNTDDITSAKPNVETYVKGIIIRIKNNKLVADKFSALKSKLRTTK